MRITRINESSEESLASAMDYKWLASDGHEIDIKRVCNQITAVKDDVISTWPKIGSALRSKPILVSELVDTAATDGYAIYFSPEWAEDMLNDQNCGPLYLEFALVHEMFHILYRHAFEEAIANKKYNDHNRANRAKDYQINYIIGNCLRCESGTETPFLEPASCGHFCYDKKFAGKDWREIYPLIEATKEERPVLEPEAVQAFIDEYNRMYDEKVKSGELM